MCKDFRPIFLPIFKDFGRKSAFNSSEIKIQFTLDIQYDGKVATNQLSVLRTMKFNVANAKLHNLFIACQNATYF